MRFTLNRNKLLAIGIVTVQLLAQSSEELTGKEKLIATIALAAAAAVLQVLAHNRNPDGSDAKEPWKPKQEKEN